MLVDLFVYEACGRRHREALGARVEEVEQRKRRRQVEECKSRLLRRHHASHGRNVIKELWIQAVVRLAYRGGRQRASLFRLFDAVCEKCVNRFMPLCGVSAPP